MNKTTLTQDELNRHIPDFYPRIFRMVRLMVYGSGLDPEDITQESFLKLYRKRHLYNGKSSLYTWTYQIAKNTVLDALRRRKIQKKLFWWTEAEIDVNLFESDEDGEETLDRRERQFLLSEALRKMNEKDRLIITLRDMEGMSYEEIAKIENIAAGTVKSRLFTARQRLRDELIRSGLHHRDTLSTRKAGSKKGDKDL